MEYVTLSNGVKMPIMGYGVYQVTKKRKSAARFRNQDFREKKSFLPQKCG